MKTDNGIKQKDSNNNFVDLYKHMWMCLGSDDECKCQEQATQTKKRFR